MKYRRLALLALVSACALLRAQDDEEKNRRPPTEIPDFSNLDEYIYEPKSAVQLGFRHLGGAKTSFQGTGTILSPEGALPGAGPNQLRVYHDGSVSPDARTAPRTDSAGNPIVDPTTGTTIGEPIPPDGKTNTWSYVNDQQVSDAPLGFIAFHSYSADVSTGGERSGESTSTNGLDLAVTRDMGKLFGTRVSWKLIAGMSTNDINGSAAGTATADIHVLTDYYSTFGQNVPAAPYSAPTFSGLTDTSVLLSNQPVYSDTSTEKGNQTAVMNTWKVKGAYYTFRGGMVLLFPITSKFHIDVSFGPALIYAGTTYRVMQEFTPELGDPIVEVDSRAAYKFRPGVYADASVGYDLTDKTGFFAGAVFQTAQGYTQSLHTATAEYSTKIDLSNQNGFRAGMSVRF